MAPGIGLIRELGRQGADDHALTALVVALGGQSAVTDPITRLKVGNVAEAAHWPTSAMIEREITRPAIQGP